MAYIDDLGAEMVSTPAVPPTDLDDLGVHAGHLRRRRRLLTAGAAGLVAAAIAIPLLLLNQGDDDAQLATAAPSATAGATTTATPAGTATPTPDPQPLTATIGSPLDDSDPTISGANEAQPTEGDGWRLLTAEDRGDPYTSNVALDPNSYETLWTNLGLTGAPPEVDFEREIVAHLGTTWSSGCADLRLDDVAFDLEGRLVYGEFVLPDADRRDCAEDLNARAYIVALERSALPESPFRLQVTREIACIDCGTEVTVVDLTVAPSADGITSTYRLLTDAPEVHAGPVTRELTNGDLESRWTPSGCPETVEVSFAPRGEALDTTVTDTSEETCPAEPYESILTITPDQSRSSYAVLVDESGLVSEWSWGPFTPPSGGDSQTVTRSDNGLRLQVNWLATACDVRPGVQIRGSSAASLTVAIGSGEPVAPCPSTDAVGYQLEVTFSSAVDPAVRLAD